MLADKPLRRDAGGANIDADTVLGFGREWETYDQSKLTGAEFERLFDSYFSIFPFDEIGADAEGFDLGCGSGRWAAGVARRVGRLHCIDPSEEALGVAKRRLAGIHNVDFHLAASEAIPLKEGSQDFGYSIGVLHHIPDTRSALRDCVAKLKPGAPFLVYLYYAFDNRPGWYRLLWRASDVVRRRISRLPFALRRNVTALIAGGIYWPLARIASLAEKGGVKVDQFPLAAYRSCSFYTMRTDALDRFGTRLEHRFSREEVRRMMEQAGLERIEFSEAVPFWTACGRRKA